MTAPRPRIPNSSALLTIVGVVLLVLYVGSYCVLLRTDDIRGGGMHWRVYDYTLQVPGIESFYYPLHWLDTKLRPDFWHEYQ